MNKIKKMKSNKSTLVAAALIVTASTATFGAMANESEGTQNSRMTRLHESLTAEQHIIMEEAHELLKAGDKEAAKRLLNNAGIKKPESRRHRKKMKHFFMENLSEEQKITMEKAHKLKKSGKIDEARDLIEEAGINFQGRKKHQAFMDSLTDEQKEAVKEAHELFKMGNSDAAKEILRTANVERQGHKVREPWEAGSAS